MSNSSAIKIDVYQATMLFGYYRAGMANRIGTMEAFTRKLPAKRNFLVACGTERILQFIHELKFTTADINLLKEILNPQLMDPFTEADGNYLAGLNFADTLKVRSMYDGEIAFANEPVISVTGPIGMVQYIERRLLGILNGDIRIASKAARIIIAAGDTPVSEMGGRRIDDDAGVHAARAAYIAGFANTSSVEAYAEYGIPCMGTMGHVWPMSHKIKGMGKRESQQKSFTTWGNIYKNSTYIVDTYDTQDGVNDAIDCARANLGAVRLDSGDFKLLSPTAKRLLNKAEGCNKSKVGATNDLNEYKIKELKDAHAPIDMFGVGTEVVCTPDSPTNNFVYKLVSIKEDDGSWTDIAKFSEGGKGTLPCAKQVRRFFDPYSGLFTHDEIQKVGNILVSHAEDIVKERDVKNWSKEAYDAHAAKNSCKIRMIQMPPYLKLIEDTESGSKFTVLVSEEIRKVQQALKDEK